MAFEDSDPVMAWLLDPVEPAMRFLASRDLLEPRPSAHVLGRLRQEVPRAGWASRLLASQREGSWWAAEATCYWPKMRGTFWQLEVLADLGLRRQDPRVANAVEHMLRLHLAPDGGFSPFGPPRPSHFCSTGIMARTLLQLGYLDDRRTWRAVDCLVKAQLPEGGWDCRPPQESTLDAWEALAAFAAIPERRRTREVRGTIKRGAEFFLSRRLLHEGAPYPRWSQLHYPWHYWYDVLVGLDVLTALGYAADPRMREALALLESKRMSDGRWTLDGANGDLRVEAPGKPSKMVTFLALRTLKRAGRFP